VDIGLKGSQSDIIPDIGLIFLAISDIRKIRIFVGINIQHVQPQTLVARAWIVIVEGMVPVYHILNIRLIQYRPNESSVQNRNDSMLA
jgi:hypothetical protein